MRTTDELIENFHGIIDALEARLTLAESALSAAGKLLEVLEMKDITCHKEVGDYHLAKARWDAAREALK